MQHVTEGPELQRNFLVVDSKTETSAIEKAFQNFTQERKDIGILLINQHVRRKHLFFFDPVKNALALTKSKLFF
jgi:vacuolar-type H+-ATPase subunit F/Vma7